MNPPPYYHIVDFSTGKEEFAEREGIIKFLQKDYHIDENNWREVIENNKDTIFFEDYPWYESNSEEIITILKPNHSSIRCLQVEGMPRHDKQTLELLKTKKCWEINEIRKLEGW